MNKIIVNLCDKQYSINIERGILNSIGERLKDTYRGRNVAVITDKNVDKFYGNCVKASLESNGFKFNKFVIEPGEKSKSIGTLLEIYDKLLEFGITRGDLIIALGGGVVGDLAGFAASTFLRGVPYIQVPTTLLAQVDSSIGGKVAVDLPKGKNLIGSFYHPEEVFMDPEVLKTLDSRILHDGMGEVIKYGAIKDNELFNTLLKFKDDEELLNNIEDIILKCCSIKRDIVERDEKDTGERMLLNFGHTIGHAAEKYFNFEKLTHGEAVSIGMYTMAKNGETLGKTKDGTSDLLKTALEKYKLPYDIQNLDKNKLIDFIKLDKKNTGNNISIILLKEIGEAFIEKIESENMKAFV